MKSVRHFSDYGIEDELTFALMFIADKMRLSKHGRARIVYALRQKGVSAEVIAEAYAAIEEDPQRYIEADDVTQAELENATALIAKKYKNGGLTDADTIRKAAAFLARRGYSAGIVRQAINTNLQPKQ